MLETVLAVFVTALLTLLRLANGIVGFAVGTIGFAVATLIAVLCAMFWLLLTALYFHLPHDPQVRVNGQLTALVELCDLVTVRTPPVVAADNFRQLPCGEAEALAAAPAPHGATRIVKNRRTEGKVVFKTPGGQQIEVNRPASVLSLTGKSHRGDSLELVYPQSKPTDVYEAAAYQSQVIGSKWWFFYVWLASGFVCLLYVYRYADLLFASVIRANQRYDRLRRRG